MSKIEEISKSEAVLDHVAIAVKSIEKALGLYNDLGIIFSPEREVVPDQGVVTAFATIDKNAHLELLEPLDDKSAIFDFIQKFGEGVHHICYKVKDVKKLGDDLKSKGYRLIYDRPVKGAKNCLVNFIHPKSAGGVLIEISQHIEN